MLRISVLLRQNSVGVIALRPCCRLMHQSSMRQAVSHGSSEVPAMKAKMKRMATLASASAAVLCALPAYYYVANLAGAPLPVSSADQVRAYISKSGPPSTGCSLGPACSWQAALFSTTVLCRRTPRTWWVRGRLKMSMAMHVSCASIVSTWSVLRHRMYAKKAPWNGQSRASQLGHYRYSASWGSPRHSRLPIGLRRQLMCSRLMA